MTAPEIKFCGLTRVEDAALAAELGAAYVGVIFAGGPRRLDPSRARAVLDGIGPTPVWRVGVFGAQGVEEIARIADEAALDVVQLHDGVSVDRLLSLRERFGGAIWGVIGVSGATFTGVSEAIAATVDALVLDTSVGGRSGGTGVVFDWVGASPVVSRLRARHRLVLAGGLRPANVAEAVRTLHPHVVDVSSGVESMPGIKDPALMRAFAEAARSREER